MWIAAQSTSNSACASWSLYAHHVVVACCFNDDRHPAEVCLDPSLNACLVDAGSCHKLIITHVHPSLDQQLRCSHWHPWHSNDR